MDREGREAPGGPQEAEVSIKLVDTTPWARPFEDIMQDARILKRLHDPARQRAKKAKLAVALRGQEVEGSEEIDAAGGSAEYVRKIRRGG